MDILILSRQVLYSSHDTVSQIARAVPPLYANQQWTGENGFQGAFPDVALDVEC